jgi:hypothetical protein
VSLALTARSPETGRCAPDGTPAPGDYQVLPILWSDNDITVWPEESKTLIASYRRRM